MDKWSQEKKTKAKRSKKELKNRVCWKKNPQLFKNLGDKARKEKCVCTRAGTEWTEIKHVRTAVSHFPLSVGLSVSGSL